MRVWLRSTYPFFLPSLASAIVISTSAFATLAQADELQINKQLQMSAPEKTDAKTPKTNDGVVRDPRVLNAAKMYEKYFLGQMMKAMRSTVMKSDLEKPSMGEGIYREQLDDQYVDSWGDQGGIGLANMIHDQLLGKAQMLKMRREAMREAKGKARTPMALTDRDVLKTRRLPSTAAGQETVLVSLGKTLAGPGDAPESVRSPWAGKVQSIKVDRQSDVTKTVIGVEAAIAAGQPARKVELAFDGVPFQVAEGDVIQAGQTVGQLGKGARGILLRQTLVQDLVKPSLDAGLEPSKIE